MNEREALEAIQDIAANFKTHWAAGSQAWTIAELHGMFNAVEKICAKALAPRD